MPWLLQVRTGLRDPEAWFDFNLNSGNSGWRDSVVSTALVLLILFIAAILEAGGDALVRAGLHGSSSRIRFALMGLGAVVLFAYGYVVNSPSWDFGRLLGVYVVFFFVVAQLISWWFFAQRPTAPILLGGACIVAGGLIISAWRP